jgi:ADP-ribosylglycohydrolase
VRRQRTNLVRMKEDVEFTRGEKAQEEERLRALRGQRSQSLAQTRQQAQQTQARLRRIAQDEQRLTSVIATLEAARVPPADFQRQSGWVRTALQNAFHRALAAPSLEDGIVETVMAGGDTDTNAAIAGALLGAVHGRNALPAAWRSPVLTARALPGTPRPRPQCLWPVDAEDLAERLLGGSDPV